MLLPLPGKEPWNRHTIDESSKGADGVRLADVNGDGLMDIATGWEEGGVVRAYLHPGSKNCTAKWPAVTVGTVKSAEDAVFADLDGDGASDVVSCCEGRTRSIYFHWAPRAKESFLDAALWETTKLPATAGKQMWMYAFPMQIDGKHGVDLFVGSKGGNGSVGWLQAPENPRDLSKWTFHKLQDAGWIMSLILADMNGDQIDDLLVSDRRGSSRGIFWLQNPGPEKAANPGAWKRHDIGDGKLEIKFITIGDLDQDGLDDVIATEKKSIVWYRLEDKKWVQRIIPLPNEVGGGKSVVVSDINGDGRNDLVFSCEGAKAPLSGVRWLSWDKSPLEGIWSDHEVSGPEGLKYDRLVVSDVDGDGDPDLLCCEERDQLGVFWYENPFQR
ncbi:MAG: FG-GAP repeat domain-containing protein [Akkermansiaceae bacterium]